MIDKLVSRFLYVLCWRNKVVIILIILSASMAMLMMLSYHGNNKHQMTVDEILHSGKGHLPIDHQFGNRKSKANLGSTIMNVANREVEPQPQVQGQSVQRRFLERDVERKKPPDDYPVPMTRRVAKVDNDQDPEHGARRDKPHLRAPEGNTHYHGLPAPEKVPTANMVVHLEGVHIKQQEVQASTGNSRPLSQKGLDNREHPKRKRLNQSLQDANVNDAPTRNSKFQKKDSSRRMRHSLRVRNNEENAVPPIVSEHTVNKPVENLRPISNQGAPPIKVQGKKGWRNSNTMDNRIDSNVRGTSQPLHYKGNIQNHINSVQGTPPAYINNQQNQVKIMRNNQDWWKQRKSPTVNSPQKKDQFEQNGVLPQRDDTLRLQGQLKKLPSDQAYENNSPHDLRIQKLEKLRKSLDAIQEHKLSVNVDMLRNRLINYTKDLQNLHRFVKDPKQPRVTEKPGQAGQDSDFSWKRTTPPVENRITPNISSMILALARQRKPVKIFSPYHASTLYRPKGSWPEMMSQWVDTEERYCDDYFVVMNSEFAILKDVIIDRNFCHGRNGGEEIVEVINQPEDEEYYTYFPGFFQLPCQIKPQYFFNNNNHLNQWLYSISSIRDQNLYSEMRQQFTIAIVRYEYANLYHTTTDFYNAFLLMEFFNKTQVDTNILLVDGHPKGALDPVWDVLFNSSHRINKQSTRTKYPNLVWGILGYNSPMMDHYAPSIPLIEEFRTFFLSSYRITNTRKVDCDKINILFIWRRDYVAHPRNPSGSISRKIQNEQELVGTLRQNFPSFSVKGVQIDLFEMDQQLKFITETDVLIGMHGAGLTHAMFLPKHAGMIELLPTYWSAANEHFHAIARWRRLHYRQWVNADPQNEAPNHFTKIPPEVLNELVTDMVKVVCGLATDPPDIFVAQ